VQSTECKPQFELSFGVSIYGGNDIMAGIYFKIIPEGEMEGNIDETRWA
jgi:hypothetical protein